MKFKIRTNGKQATRHVKDELESHCIAFKTNKIGTITTFIVISNSEHYRGVLTDLGFSEEDKEAAR